VPLHPTRDNTSRDMILFFSSRRRRHTRSKRDWSSDVCSSDLEFVFLKVKLAFPVIAHNKYIDIMIFNICLFLFPVLFRNHFIDKIGRASCRERVYLSMMRVPHKTKLSIEYRPVMSQSHHIL